MKVAYVLPRNMSFSPRNATAIDLCVKENVENSKFRDSTRIFGAQVEKPFPGFDFIQIKTRFGTIIPRQLVIELEKFNPDIIVVEQFAPIGMCLKKHFKETKLVLRKHANNKTRISKIKHFTTKRDLDIYDKLIFVSNFCKETYISKFSSLKKKSDVIYNGFEPTEWPQEKNKLEKIIFVGRCAEEKGAINAVEAALNVIKIRPSWSANFVFSTFGCEGVYVDRVKQLIASNSPHQVHAEFDVPFSQVQRRFLEASIAVVPSIFDESFGRTALEAMAARCALVTSLRGGLAEVAASFCVSIDPTDIDDIAGGVLQLIDDPKHRVLISREGNLHAARHFSIRDKSRELDCALERIAAA